MRGRFVALLALVCVLAGMPAEAARPAPADPPDGAARLQSWEAHQALEQSSQFRGLPWRSVGPVAMGGRVIDIEVVPGAPYTFYVAYASGGLWRTTNNGVTFEPLFDDQIAMILGDVALDPQNPQTIWVGTGENNSSRSSYGGAGVLRSDDGGKTWRHMGLWETDRIGRISVDPRDSDRVLVASLGPLYTSGGARGIYLTEDGGKNWKQVLEGIDHTGFVEMVRDPNNPDVLYASSWERSRLPWDFTEGGFGSGIWKSVDAGDNWTQLDGGLPRGDHVGRIGLAVAQDKPGTLYALIDNQQLMPEEAWDMGDGAVTPKRLRGMSKEEFLRQDPEEIEDFLRGYDLDPELTAQKLLEKVRNDDLSVEDLLSALSDANRSLLETDVLGPEVWRSDDGGKRWRRTHEDPIRELYYTYGYYFGQIRVAPTDHNRLYILGVPMLTSGDGGRNWKGIRARNLHVDHQSLWVDPEVDRHLIGGNDGGVNMSFDGGESWLQLNQVPVGQFYTVAVDMARPYNIYGGLQDNGVWKGSSTSRPGVDPWRKIGGGDGAFVQVDPRDNKTTILGLQFGNYRRIGEDPGRVKPRNRLLDPALRYNWMTPVLLSTHNPDILYFGANKVFRSMDQGDSWTAISPDLTRSDERGDVPFATLTSIDESPQRFGLLWAGTDDGHVHVTRSGGAEWSDVSDGLPRDRWVTRVAASPHEENVGYVTLSGYRNDDIRAYVYRTDDLGKTWTDISAGLPAEPVNVIREDPVNRRVLYVGTDRGVYVSLDRGESWQALQSGLPNVPVHDLVVHPRERELIAGTHGRSVWVVDVLPVQELEYVQSTVVHVYPQHELKAERGWRSRRPVWRHYPDSEPYRDIPFWVQQGGRATFTVHDEDERVLRREELFDLTPGVNTYRWDLRLDPALALRAEEARLAEEESEKSEETGGASLEPPKRAKVPWSEALRLGRPLFVTPGNYILRVESAGFSAETEIRVQRPQSRDPRTPARPKIRAEQKKDESGKPVQKPVKR